MDEFLRAVAEALTAAGLDAKHDGLYVRVGRARFDAEWCRADRKDSDKMVVKFLNSTFKEPYNIAKAVGLVMQALPKRIQEALASDRYLEASAALRREFKDRMDESDNFQRWRRLSSTLSVGYSRENQKFLVRVECSTLEELRQEVEAHQQMKALAEREAGGGL
jgi:hypothetical protein